MIVRMIFGPRTRLIQAPRLETAIIPMPIGATHRPIWNSVWPEPISDLHGKLHDLRNDEVHRVHREPDKNRRDVGEEHDGLRSCAQVDQRALPTKLIPSP